jgi:hypothetical protein
MFHPNTQRLIDYWRAKKGAAPVLARSRLDPAEIAGLLPRVFMAERSDGGYRLRLAGQFIVDAHAGAKAGDDLLSLWSAEDRWEVRRMLDRALAGAAPIVIAAEMGSERGRVHCLEIAFAPVCADGGPPDRFLGLYQSLGGVPGHLLAGRLRLTRAEADSVPPPRALRLAAVDGLRIA